MLAAKEQNFALGNLLLQYHAETTRKDSLDRTADKYTMNKDIKQLLLNSKEKS